MIETDGNCFSTKTTSYDGLEGDGSLAKEKNVVAVTTSYRTFKHTCSRPQYDMSGDRLMYIFNHKEYKKTAYYPYDIATKKKPKVRSGTGEDVKRLNEVFGKLNFKIAKTCDDYSRNKIRKTVNEICEMDHSNTSCVAIAILTHGHSKEVLCASDRPYHLSDVVNKVLNVKQLAGKPKIFFIQACRGDEGDEGHLVEVDGDDGCGNIPTRSDLLILRANFEGFVSFRSPDFGSWMIQTLCDIVEMHHKEKDILHMLIMVNNYVATNTSRAKEDKYDKKKQIPVIRFTLRKLLMF